MDDRLKGFYKGKGVFVEMEDRTLIKRTGETAAVDYLKTVTNHRGVLAERLLLAQVQSGVAVSSIGCDHVSDICDLADEMVNELDRRGWNLQTPSIEELHPDFLTERPETTDATK